MNQRFRVCEIDELKFNGLYIDISAVLDAKSTFILCCSLIDIFNNSIGQLDNKSGNKILNNLLKYPIGDPYNLNLSKFDRVHFSVKNR